MFQYFITENNVLVNLMFKSFRPTAKQAFADEHVIIFIGYLEKENPSRGNGAHEERNRKKNGFKERR